MRKKIRKFRAIGIWLQSNAFKTTQSAHSALEVDADGELPQTFATSDSNHLNPHFIELQSTTSALCLSNMIIVIIIIIQRQTPAPTIHLIYDNRWSSWAPRVTFSLAEVEPGKSRLSVAGRWTGWGSWRGRWWKVDFDWNDEASCHFILPFAPTLMMIMVQGGR